MGMCAWGVIPHIAIWSIYVWCVNVSYIHVGYMYTWWVFTCAVLTWSTVYVCDWHVFVGSVVICHEYICCVWVLWVHMVLKWDIHVYMSCDRTKCVYTEHVFMWYIVARILIALSYKTLSQILGVKDLKSIWKKLKDQRSIVASH